jgi:hypothetical protein
MGFFGAFGFHPRNIVVPPPIITGYDQIQDEGVNLTQENILDFQGSGVTASNGVGKTIVNVPIQPAYSTIQEEGTPLTQQPILDFQGTGVIASNGVGKTIVTIPGNIPATNYGLYAQTANSTLITGTNVESSLIGSGVGTLSVPANGFSVGDSFQANLSGIMSAKNNDTITIRVKSGATILGFSPPFVMPGINNQVWNLTINFTIRNLGIAGVASLVVNCEFHILKLASGTQEGFGFNTINTTTFDTTIPNTLGITVQWSSNSAINSIYSNQFVLNKTY